MKKYSEIEKILYSCSRYSFKLKNLNGLCYIQNKNIDNEDEVLKMQEYLNTVQNAINTMSKELQDVIKDYYFNNKRINELHYSQATFYNRKNKALKILEELLIKN